MIFDNFKIKKKELIIPHPKIKERKFSLFILKDIFGDKYISDLDNSVDEMLMIVMTIVMLKFLNNDYKYIAIEGNIGVGKTTLAKFFE